MSEIRLLEKTYNPKDFEDKWYAYWLKGAYFHSKVDYNKTPYSILMPPPNITAKLHMGHGLNNTIQDILIRWKKMSGFNTLWMPGTDHAGIATQNVVEKELARKENKTRHSISREDFVKKVWEWKGEYGSFIIEQLKKLACACDWERERFTMDAGLSYAVREAFVRLYEDGLIYRGKYIVNWCPRCETALSQEEVNHKEIDGFFYHIKYPLKDSRDTYIEIATTRPETMLGDTAVAVNPKDERYKKLIGKTIILPLVKREIPIIADEYSKMDFGSGAVKVTPAHDPNDFLIAKRHNLEKINIMNRDATINENAPLYEGLSRFECRSKIIEDLREQGLFIKKEKHTNSIGHCYRCSTIIEPNLSDQWFVRMKPLAKKAISVVREGKIEFYPKKWTKVYLHWMDNIEDWCISRQIWWGHRIPVWDCLDCGNTMVLREDTKTCHKCLGTNIKQDEDVLDTWFSSWLWPFSTLGWPDPSAKKDIDYFYPTNVLSTAPEILFFWVARMIMAGLYFIGDIPFREVYLHSTVRDKIGRKMSKSLGNGIDPIDVIKKHSADVLRFTITNLAPIGQDIRLAFDDKENDFLVASRFANKIWNVSRYILMNIEKGDFSSDINKLTLSLAEQWILHKLQLTINKANENLESFRFNDFSKTLYDFIWHDFCDWYVEISKIELYKKDNHEKKETVSSILIYVLSVMLKLLHPIMPCITEELWQHLVTQYDISTKSIMLEPYPSCNQHFIADSRQQNFDIIKDAIYHIRNIRANMNIPHAKAVDIIIKFKEKQVESLFQAYKHYITSLSKIATLTITDNYENNLHCASAISQKVEIFIPLKGAIDLDKERDRINKEIEKTKKSIDRIKTKLENKTFILKAKEEIVKKEKDKLEETENSLAKLEKHLSVLS